MLLPTPVATLIERPCGSFPDPLLDPLLTPCRWHGCTTPRRPAQPRAVPRDRHPTPGRSERRVRPARARPESDTPPSGSAPGETGVTKQEHGRGQFQEAYDSVPDEVAASGALARDRDEDD